MQTSSALSPPFAFRSTFPACGISNPGSIGQYLLFCHSPKRCDTLFLSFCLVPLAKRTTFTMQKGRFQPVKGHERQRKRACFATWLPVKDLSMSKATYRTGLSLILQTSQQFHKMNSSVADMAVAVIIMTSVCLSRHGHRQYRRTRLGHRRGNKTASLETSTERQDAIRHATFTLWLCVFPLFFVSLSDTTHSRKERMEL